MIEAGMSAAIALITGLGMITQRMNSRITELDRRLGEFELRVVADYMNKSEFATSINKIEEHMVRIEDKIDNLLVSRK
tara:strand:+ start:508 stop:741 length:234 start_codon:yes stop_codon:yes gene_type:complete